MHRTTWTYFLLLAAVTQAPTAAKADLAAGVNVIAAWTRPAGSYSDVREADRGKVLALDPYGLKSKVRARTLFDLQYDDKRTYRGVTLQDLVDAYPNKAERDTVLLHFDNGMTVPVPLVDLQTLGAFLALETCEKGNQNCGITFPESPRKDVYTLDDDPQPIAFTWNKLVVSRPWHPEERRVDKSGFSPWRHVDTLVGLEFVDAEAYRAQFAVGASGGEDVFFKRCQYCHGVRSVGASFGWDFVSPLPLYEKRAPANLLNHVKYPKAMAQRLGIQMPPQKDVGSDEVNLLWRWMRDVAKSPVKSYRP